MNNQNNSQKGLLARFTRGSRHRGFTLIELLATLTIMAVIAAILFPFISNYTRQATVNSSLRSLRLLQDAMDRYRASNEDGLQWQLGSDTITATVNSVAYTNLTGPQTATILSNITISSGNNLKTMSIPADGLTTNIVKIASSGTSTLEGAWEVVWFRKNTNANTLIVDRKKNEYTNWATQYNSSALSNAFVNQ